MRTISMLVLALALLLALGCGASQTGPSVPLYQCSCGTTTDVYVTTGSTCGEHHEQCKLLGHLPP